MSLNECHERRTFPAFRKLIGPRLQSTPKMFHIPRFELINEYEQRSNGIIDFSFEKKKTNYRHSQEFVMERNVFPGKRSNINKNVRLNKKITHTHTHIQGLHIVATRYVT